MSLENKRIKIVHLLEATAGGTKKHLMDILMRLDPSRFELTLICSTLRDKRFYTDIERLLDNNIEVKIIKMRRAIRPLSDLAALLQIYIYLRRRPFDILHAHSSKAGFLGRLAGKLAGVKNILYSPHCYYFQQKKGLVRSIFLRLEQFAGFFTDIIVAISEGERKITIQENIFESNGIVTIVNGIDPSEFEFDPGIAETKKKLGIDPDSPVVGTISRFTAQKGYRYFFQTAAQVHKNAPDVVFLVLGQEKNKIHAEKLIDMLGISDRVVLLSHSDEVRELIAAMDVFVLSSLWEGLPYALLEAMAMKKPVVASHIPGVDEVVKHQETGYLVKAGDTDVFAKRILELLNDSEKAKTMGEKGWKVIQEKYRVETQIQKLSDLYEAVSRSEGLKEMLSESRS